MENVYAAIIDTPLGKLGIQLSAEKLIGIDFLPSSKKILNPTTKLAQKTVKQLQNYFSSSQSFDLPLQLQGTEFQQRVWHALTKIPRGKVVTYGDLANQLNSGARAIGNACRRNPIPVIVPCHRVVAANHLGGYSGAIQGAKMEIKKWLLQHEGWISHQL